MKNDTAKEVISYKKVVRQELLSFKTSILMSFSKSVFGALSERVSETVLLKLKVEFYLLNTFLFEKCFWSAFWTRFECILDVFSMDSS